MIPHSKPTIGTEEIDAVTRVLQSGMLAQGREVAAFEAECAAFVGRRYGVAVSSGTAALHLTFLGLGLGEGAQIALPSYGCAALLQAVEYVGARAVLADCGDDFNVVAESVAPDADAAVLVHLFGAQAPVPRAGVLIEDLAQSVGGPTGRAGVAAILSFYATKLLTTGEGGMVLTDDEGLAEALRDRRDYDNRDDFKPRFAAKMTEMAAAMGRVQLRRLPGFIAARRALAAQYAAGLAGLPLRLPGGDDHVYFRYVVQTPARDELKEHLRAEGIEAKRPVHRPLHHYTLDSCPKAEKAHLEALSLPVYPALSSENAETVLQSVQRFFARRG